MTTTHDRRQQRTRAERLSPTGPTGAPSGSDPGASLRGDVGRGDVGQSCPAVGTRRSRDAARLVLLTTGSAADVLARLVDGDPLALRARVRRRAAERCLVVPPEPLFQRAAAHCARRAENYRGRPSPGPWIEREVEQVLDDWLADSDAPRVESTDPDPDTRAKDASEGGANEGALECCARRFNALPLEERTALWRLAFAGCSLDELAHERESGLSRTARRVRRALDAVLGDGVLAEQGEVA